MTHVVTRHDFRKTPGKYMKMAETQTVIIIRNKLAGWEDGCVLISWKQYEHLKSAGVLYCADNKEG